MKNFEKNNFFEITLCELEKINGGILHSGPSNTMITIFSESFHAFVDFTEGLMSGYNQTYRR